VLAYVYRAKDNLFVNLTLAREGFAVPYTFPPNVAHTAEFVAAAAEARDAHRGLWSACRHV
jgi:micrococcal nuclease